MSTSLFIEDIHHKGCITVEQVLEIGQDFSQYTVGEDDEEYNDFLKEKIGNFECVLLGKENVSARGFELSYDDKTGSYVIRIFTPSAVADYEIAFDYLKKLCAFLGNNKITTEDNEAYTTDTITAYNYKEQIGYALEAIYNNLKNSDHEHFEIFGLHRPVALNKKIIKEIIKTKEAVKNFSSFITNLQYIDAYSARQKIYKKDDGSIFGVYTITETVPTIIPFTPCIEYENADTVKDSDVSQWLIGLVVIDGDPNDPGSYSVYKYIEHKKFVKRLPGKKYTVLDAKYIRIEGLTRKEIESIAK